MCTSIYTCPTFRNILIHCKHDFLLIYIKINYDNLSATLIQITIILTCIMFQKSIELQLSLIYNWYNCSHCESTVGTAEHGDGTVASFSYLPSG